MNDECVFSNACLAMAHGELKGGVSKFQMISTTIDNGKWSPEPEIHLYI